LVIFCPRVKKLHIFQKYNYIYTYFRKRNSVGIDVWVRRGSKSYFEKALWFVRFPKSKMYVIKAHYVYSPKFLLSYTKMNLYSFSPVHRCTWNRVWQTPLKKERSKFDNNFIKNSFVYYNYTIMLHIFISNLCYH